MTRSLVLFSAVLSLSTLVACGDEKDPGEDEATADDGGDDGSDDGTGDDGGGDDGGSDDGGSDDGSGDDGGDEGGSDDGGDEGTDGDSDGDGLSDEEEAELGTDPNNPDTDGDGLSDGEEMSMGTSPLEADSDGDGLSDSEEAELGTDSSTDDTDSDGYTDAEEVDAYTDPTDSTDHPYTGGWPIGSCRHDLESVATAAPRVGSVAPNFALMDQYGDSVKLHDFCEQAVLIVVSAEWCGPCQSYRSTLQDYWEDYHSQGLVILDILGESASGGSPSQSTLVSWVGSDDYVALADPGWTVSVSGYVSSYIPASSLLAEGAEVVSLDNHPITRSQIEAALP